MEREVVQDDVSGGHGHGHGHGVFILATHPTGGGGDDDDDNDDDVNDIKVSSHGVINYFLISLF